MWRSTRFSFCVDVDKCIAEMCEYPPGICSPVDFYAYLDGEDYRPFSCDWPELSDAELKECLSLAFELWVDCRWRETEGYRYFDRLYCMFFSSDLL
ncbi:hypothetical protein CMUST_12365 [Corynebacterium mustelae]|uniref:Uncharacterized protein n=1 Tax=Corynebacterium mustelae TaxID=571915 RepID=A0A0G3H042_9CORY|nr:hypothetical protein CMUST_12365 [Corynebacterium mustelae]